MKAFDALDYTREALAEELSLTERHARDGSAVDAGCACIEEKHLLTIAGLASEGVTLSKDKQEKEFYLQLANLARELRKNIVYADFDIHAVMRGIMKEKYPKPHGGFENPKAVVSYPKNMGTQLGENEVDYGTGQIRINLHPKLKKDKKAHDIVFRHEMREAICNLETANACHITAAKLGGKEEEQARKKYKTPLYANETDDGFSPKILSKCEKKLERCIIKVKQDRSDVNPYAVCKAKIKC